MKRTGLRWVISGGYAWYTDATMPKRTKETRELLPEGREKKRNVFEQKNRLFELMRNLDVREQQAGVMRIMQHSVEDGFEFARMLGLDARQKAQAFFQPEVYLKHDKLLDEVRATVFKNEEVLREQLVGDEASIPSAILRSVRHFQSWGGPSAIHELHYLPLSERAAIESRVRRGLLLESWWSTEKWKHYVSEEIVDAIDSYYAPFLAQRELAPMPQEKHDVVAEQEEYLDLVDDVARGLYYTGPVQRMLLSRVVQQEPESVRQYYRERVEKEEGGPTAKEFAELCRRGDSRQALDFLDWQLERRNILEDVRLRLMHSSVIPADLLTPLLTAFGIDADSPEVKRVLARAQYKMADVLFTSQKSHGVRALERELETSLSLRGIDIGKVTFVLDEQSGAYRAMYDGKPMERPEKGEGEKGKAEEAEAELRMKPWIVPRQDIEQVLQRYKMIESAQRVGREYSFHVHDQNNRSFVVAENGQVGRRYLGIYHPTAVGNELYFAAVGGGKSFIVSPDGTEGKRYDAIGALASVGDSLNYSAREGGKSFIVYPDGKEGKRYDDTVNGKLKCPTWTGS